MKLIQRCGAAFALGLALLIPTAVHAGGNQVQQIAKFTQVKSPKGFEQMKDNETIVKVCRGCETVTLIRVQKGGKGLYDSVAKKCEDCGSDDTYVATSKSPVLLNEERRP